MCFGTFLYNSRKKSYRLCALCEHNHTGPKWCQEIHHLFSVTVSLYCVLLSPSEEELRKLREEMNVETLKQELEKEKLKRLELEQKMNEILKTRYENRICFLCSCSKTNSEVVSFTKCLSCSQTRGLPTTSFQNSWSC